jgi:hypothetical protein
MSCWMVLAASTASTVVCVADRVSGRAIAPRYRCGCCRIVTVNLGGVERRSLRKGSRRQANSEKADEQSVANFLTA